MIYWNHQLGRWVRSIDRGLIHQMQRLNCFRQSVSISLSPSPSLTFLLLQSLFAGHICTLSFVILSLFLPPSLYLGRTQQFLPHFPPTLSLFVTNSEMQTRQRYQITLWMASNVIRCNRLERTPIRCKWSSSEFQLQIRKQRLFLTSKNSHIVSISNRLPPIHLLSSSSSSACDIFHRSFVLVWQNGFRQQHKNNGCLCASTKLHN